MSRKEQEGEFETRIIQPAIQEGQFPSVYAEVAAGDKECNKQECKRHASHARTVLETDDYKILDFQMQNSLGFILWSTIFVTLKSGKHSWYFSNPDVNMKYIITKGSAWFLVGATGHVLRANDHICISRGQNHMLLNITPHPCLYTIEVPAKLDLGDYLGRSFGYGEEDGEVKVKQNNIAEVKINELYNKNVSAGEEVKRVKPGELPT